MQHMNHFYTRIPCNYLYKAFLIFHRTDIFLILIFFRRATLIEQITWTLQVKQTYYIDFWNILEWGFPFPHNSNPLMLTAARSRLWGNLIGKHIFGRSFDWEMFEYRRSRRKILEAFLSNNGLTNTYSNLLDASMKWDNNFNPSNAEATFVQNTRRQRLLKTILSLCWYSFDSSYCELSDEYPYAMISVICRVLRIILSWPN